MITLLTLIEGNALHNEKQENGLSKSPKLLFQNLLKEIPNEAKSNYKIPIRHVGR